MFSGSIAKASLFLALGLPLAAVGCASEKEIKHATLKPGEMPMGGKWSGVYYSQVYGYLHLTEQGNAVTGAWRNAAGDKWGEMAGEADGRLLKFEWTEHTIGGIGSAAESHGKGAFLYKVPGEKEPHEIQGQWGLGENECCEKWDAVKQMNMEPDPKSVRPDEIEGRVSGGGWDDEGGDEESDDSGSDDSSDEGEDSDSDSDSDSDKGSDAPPSDGMEGYEPL
jgi:hypothetical protein